MLEWMPGSRSCLHSEVIAPAPLSTGVPRARGYAGTDLRLTGTAMGHHNQANAGRLRRLAAAEPAKPSGVGWLGCRRAWIGG